MFFLLHGSPHYIGIGSAGACLLFLCSQLCIHVHSLLFFETLDFSSSLNDPALRRHGFSISHPPSHTRKVPPGVAMFAASDSIFRLYVRLGKSAFVLRLFSLLCCLCSCAGCWLLVKDFCATLVNLNLQNNSNSPAPPAWNNSQVGPKRKNSGMALGGRTVGMGKFGRSSSARKLWDYFLLCVWLLRNELIDQGEGETKRILNLQLDCVLNVKVSLKGKSIL